MNNVIFNIVFFIVLMILVFLFDYYLVFKRKLKKKKGKKEDIMEFNYLIGKFNLDRNKVLYKPMAFWCSLINAFIISSVVTIISNIKVKMMWQLLIGFVLLFGLIYSLYEIYGRHLKKKVGLKENV